MVLAEAPTRSTRAVIEYGWKNTDLSAAMAIWSSAALVAPDEAREWAEFTDDMMAGRRK